MRRPPSRMNRKWPVRVIVLITKLLRYAIKRFVTLCNIILLSDAECRLY